MRKCWLCGIAFVSMISACAARDAGLPAADAGAVDPLVDGGADASCARQTSEQQPGTWTRIPDMPGSRHCHSAATVDGKLYVFGGISSQGSFTAVGESNQLTDVLEFDPICNQWTVLPPTAYTIRPSSAAVVSLR